MADSIDNWIKERNHLPRKSVLVFPRNKFLNLYNRLSELNDVVFISIEDSEGEPHLVPSSENVLNIEFDDTDTDDKEKGIKAINDRQGEEIGEFISHHCGKHFIIHCTAGRSRSQGVARAIFDSLPSVYGENLYNRDNPCTTPNFAVVAVIKRFFWFGGGNFV